VSARVRAACANVGMAESFASELELDDKQAAYSQRKNRKIAGVKGKHAFKSKSRYKRKN
jgi:hypothetical protein